jgi:NADH-quinone oxidoreductase subunit G
VNMSISKVKITIDGVVIEADAGANLLQVALDHGIKIPHFCYHPALKVAGNCRMCLVEVEKMPKLQISCGTPVKEGMVVHTASEKVQKARKTVMELLLINHPLDCPICDQCGECLLQDHAFEHGQAQGRYEEAKRTYTKKSLGPLIVPEMNRCIHCTRCIRYLRDVAGSEELALTHRGGRTEVASYFATPLTSPFAMNVVELCPVGALTSGPFRFQARPWMMEMMRTICTGCARGCNVTAWSRGGVLYRITPEYNPAVNDYWLCDEGRLSIGRVRSKDRLAEPKVGGVVTSLTDAVQTGVMKLAAAKKNDSYRNVGVLFSGKLTNEELLALRRFGTEVLTGSRFFAESAKKCARPFGPLKNEPLTGWFIRDDKAPNSAGVKAVFQDTPLDTFLQLLDAIKKGEIDVLLIFGVELMALKGDEASLKEALGGMKFVMMCDTHESAAASAAHVVMPLQHHFEMQGTVINEAGMLQKLAAVVPAPASAAPLFKILSELARGLGGGGGDFTAQGLFKSVAESLMEYEMPENMASLPACGIGPAQDAQKAR